MSISDRARAAVTEMPRKASDRDRLREEWRLLALRRNEAEDRAKRYEEGRKILLARLRLELIEAGEKPTRVDDIARNSKQFRAYCQRMFDARKYANDLHIEAENADRLYWSQNNAEAQQRAEMRMSR